MTLVQRFSILFSSLFSILLAGVMATIYYSFAHFRVNEFKERLAEKAETTVKLLIEVKEIDYQLQKIIDKNTINKLYDEKTLIFNDRLQLIYSSIEDAKITWTRKDLVRIKAEKLTFRRSRAYDVLGLYFRYNNSDYYVLIAAKDRYGETKLAHLKFTLITAFLISTVLVWVLSFYVSRKSLKPLDRVRREIQEITDKNLNKRLSEPETDDELKALANSFNQMMDRIDSAYQRQKEFTGNASHELRTPIAKILAQLENIIDKKHDPEKLKKILTSITEDAAQLSEIVTSLLILSELENRELNPFTRVRLDEVIFNAASRISKVNKDFKYYFDIENEKDETIDLEIEADEILLQIAFTNLMRNAYLYSDDKTVRCLVAQLEDEAQITITNSGPTPDVDDTSVLFNTFSRGTNTRNKAGSGIGLSIVKRILQYHNARVEYNIQEKNTNKIVVRIPIRFKKKLN